MQRQNRLRKKNEFRAVFKKGEGSRRGTVFMKFIPLGDGEVPRAGIVVGKRVAKQATRRNRVKRLIGEAMRQELPKLRPVDIVLVALPGAERAGLGDIQEILRTLFRKASLYEEHERRTTNS